MLIEDEAAKKIQAVFRGHKVRASMKKGDTSSSANAKTTAPSAASNAAAAAAELEQTREELEAEFREDDKGKLNVW